MPNSENVQAISVDVNLPLLDQEEIQSFLGNPSPKRDETIVSTDLLHKFLQLAHHALAEEIKRLELQLSIQGLKVGYERKVSTETGSYIVESHFIADSDWRIDFEPELKNQVQFLNQEKQELVESADQYDQLRECLIDLTGVCGDELHRIHPKLKDCQETHVYILAHFAKDAEDARLINKEPVTNLAEESTPEAEVAPEAEGEDLILDEEKEGGLLAEIDLDGGIVLGARECPGCDDGVNKYPKRKGTMQGTVCSKC